MVIIKNSKKEVCMAISTAQAKVFSDVESLHNFAGRVHGEKSLVNPAEVKALIESLIGLRKPLGKLNQLTSEEFATSPLGQAISNNAVWKSLTNQNPSFHEPAPKKEDMENFFLLIFKFMKSDHSMNTQLQLSSMVNMTVQCSMLDRLSKQASDAMQKMDSDIQTAIDSSPNIWLSLVLPVALAVVGAIAGALTAGGGSAAAKVGEKVAEEAVATTAAKVGEGVAEEAGEEAAKAVATNVTEDSAKAAGTSATKTLGSKMKDLALAAKNKLFTWKALGTLTTIGCLTAPPVLQSSGIGVDKSGVAAQTATADGQASMSIISSSMEGAQGRIKQETSYQQNDSSNEQADLSMLQQIIQAQQQAFGLGRL